MGAGVELLKHDLVGCLVVMEVTINSEFVMDISVSICSSPPAIAAGGRNGGEGVVVESFGGAELESPILCFSEHS